MDCLTNTKGMKMNEEQQMTQYYADSLSVVSKALLKNNVMGRKQFILKIIKELNKATSNLIMLLEYEEDALA